jgi:hypothetical protein
MPEPLAFRRFAETALKLRDIVERRCAHMVELQGTGRWRHYYSEAEFRLRMEEALRLVELWRTLAPRPHEKLVIEEPGISALRDILSRAVAATPRRSAA